MIAARADSYKQSAVLTAPPERLVVMLYDGCQRFLLQATAAMREERQDVAEARLRRAEDIIDELTSTLDHERGGEVAARLQAIYAFARRHLMEGRMERDPGKLEQVAGLMAELRDAWAQLAGG